LAHFTRFLSDARRGTLSTAYCASQEERVNCTQVCTSLRSVLRIKMQRVEF